MSAPERIWLQRDADGGKVIETATWSDHEINEDDVEYVRADEHNAAMELLAKCFTFASMPRALDEQIKQAVTKWKAQGATKREP